MVNISEKWKRHKIKTAEIIKESKRRDMQHREKATKQQTKINSLTLENERLKVDLTRMEGLVNELQSIKHDQSKDRQEKEDLQAEVRKLKAENESIRASKLKYSRRCWGQNEDSGFLKIWNG